MKTEISFNDLPSKCKCGQWDLDLNEYQIENSYRGIPVVDVPKTKSAKKFNTLGLGEACFDGIEAQGFGVKHYVDYAEGFGNWNECTMETGFEDGTMSALLEVVTSDGNIHLHGEWLGCRCRG